MRLSPTLTEDCSFSGWAGQAGDRTISGFSVFFSPSGERRGIGRARGEAEQDEEGLRTMQTLGQNMAWLLKKINC